MSETPSFDVLGGEYMALVTHLRDEFATVDDREVSVTLAGAGKQIAMGFRASDQYLVRLHGEKIRDANQHYAAMPAPSILTYGQIHDAVFCGPPPMKDDDMSRLRILIFITSEAARFHIVSRNVNTLIKEMNDSTAMDFKEADFIIKNYSKAREVAGLGNTPNRFEPMIDSYVHQARRQEFDRHGKVSHMGKSLKPTDTINKLLIPQQRKLERA